MPIPPLLRSRLSGCFQYKSWHFLAVRALVLAGLILYARVGCLVCLCISLSVILLADPYILF